MTELIQLLYDYTLETSFSSNLKTAKYRMQETQTNQLSADLRRVLPPETLPLLEDYLHALEGRQLLELEAMFQAAFSLVKELR